MMPADERPVKGLVCTEDPALGDAAGRLLQASLFRSLERVDSAARTIVVAGQSSPDVIILDVAACGITGLPILAPIHEAAPRCAIVLLCPFPGLRDAAMEAGAATVVDPSDLRPLLAFLVQLRNVAHAGYECTCCPTPALRGTMPQFDPESSTVIGPLSAEGLLWRRPSEPPGGGPGRPPNVGDSS